MSEESLQACVAKMVTANVGESAIESFCRQYRKLESGDTGQIPEESIDPLLDVPCFDETADVPRDEAQEALSHLVAIKLNGGLGTSMGMDGPKSLLPVRGGRTFLDLVAAQITSVRQQWDVNLPLLLMNSFSTQEATSAALQHHPELAVEGLPLWFVQSKEPRLLADDLSPVVWPEDPSLEWCPPGHGDVYSALADCGLLDTLIDAGYWYAFVSNIDNLGARPHAGLAHWFAATGSPYAAEICLRTDNDTKGGHLATRKVDGQLILRDTAQTPAEQMAFFTDRHRHPYFHCNNLWWDLRAVRRQLSAGALDLPLIRNSKTVDPTDKSTPQVVQIETAMGAAIESFPGAVAIEVPRDRFIPVKKTNELLLLRSDIYKVTDDGELRAQVDNIPRVDLGAHYRFIVDFEDRIPVAPSLRDALSLVVDGDWTFGRDVIVKGDVMLPDDHVPHRIADGSVLDASFDDHTEPLIAHASHLSSDVGGSCDNNQSAG